ncbi:circadian clock-controlled protein daywake-like [Linepithema humile]|uniref:circadian clock-controlled protein daywake-like n=1 Tax=Linepithema humile TaxID=83485 RepID=UPI0006232DE1|nr:PREDICTED: protein takeout-like [Linepithema humile]
MYAVIIRACFACMLFTVALATIPPYIKVCSRNDPNINMCVANSIEQLRPKLTTGIPELDVPTIEPFILKRIQLLKGPKNAKLDFLISNLQVYGPSTFKIRDLKVDLKDNIIITFKVNFPKLEFRGKYRIDTQILLIRLFGEGNVTGNFLGYDSNCFLKANKVLKNNNTHINFEKMKFNIRVGKAHFNLGNLFNGDEVLGAAGNEVVNANSHLLVEELTPELENSLSDLLTNIANKITEKFTYDELFPL